MQTQFIENLKKRPKKRLRACVLIIINNHTID